MATRNLKLCPLAQHIVKMLAESTRPGHGPSYAAGKASELHGKDTAAVVAWAGVVLDGKNKFALAEVMCDAQDWPVDLEDIEAAARVLKACAYLPAINVRELLP